MKAALPAIPIHVGPCEFGRFGKLVSVRCPREFDAIMRKAGGQPDPASRRWLIEPRRIGPVIRALQSATDPLFQQAGTRSHNHACPCGAKLQVSLVCWSRAWISISSNFRCSRISWSNARMRSSSASSLRSCIALLHRR